MVQTFELIHLNPGICVNCVLFCMLFVYSTFRRCNQATVTSECIVTSLSPGWRCLEAEYINPVLVFVH